MSREEQALHGTYRCPVCGHSDSVEVKAGSPARRVECSYCGSELEVSARNGGAVQFSAQLANTSMAG